MPDTELYGNITLNEAASTFLRGGLNNSPDVLVALLEEAVGPGSVTMEHFRQGQGEWPVASVAWRRDKRKTDPRKFYQSGNVYRAISQPVGKRAGQGKLFESGSSADVYGGGPSTIQLVRNGLVIRMTTMGNGRSHLVVGFVGRYRKGARFKKLQKRVFDAFGGDKATPEDRNKARLQFAALQKRDRIRKQEAVGAKGFVRARGGKAKFVLARGSENLAYANVLQRGRFLGVKSEDGKRLFTPGQAARLKKSWAGRAALGKETVWGKKVMPLLPAKGGDMGRYVGAIERWVERRLRELGWDVGTGRPKG